MSAFIERCAHSLFNQTLQEIEYIFVDDASPDDSIAKLQQVIKQYPLGEGQVRIITHSYNRGLAAARSTAIEAARGEYIGIVDSDDYIEPNMMETMYNLAKKEDADMVVSDIVYEYPNQSVCQKDFVFEDKEERIYQLLITQKSEGFLWNKLTRSNLLKTKKNISPEKLNHREDLFTLIHLYYAANKIVKLNQALYHYVLSNPNSMTKTRTQMHFENAILFWDLTDSFLKNIGFFEKYNDEIELAKVQNKCAIMCNTRSYSLRKKYANILSNNELKYLSHFKLGEKWMLLCIHYQCFTLAHIYHKISWFKNRILPNFISKLTKNAEQ